jgi:hypothetical protein
LSFGVCPVDDAIASDGAAVLYAAPTKRSVATDERTLCETVTGFVQSYLYANRTGQELQRGLDALCSLLPDCAQCTTMVDQYLAAIYVFLGSLYTRTSSPSRNPCVPADLSCTQVVRQPAPGVRRDQALLPEVSDSVLEQVLFQLSTGDLDHWTVFCTRWLT